MATTAEIKSFIRRVRIEHDKRINANLEPMQTKLAGIETGAQVNVIESVKVDGNALTVSGKSVNISLSDYAKKSDISSVYKVKGTVAKFSELPSNAEVGDVYNITAKGGTDENGVAIKAGDNVVKTSTGWDNLGGTVDLSAYVTSAEIADERTKLAGIAAGAQVNVIESVKVDGTALAISGKAVNIDLSGKVDKVTGKQLSTNDFTDAYKTDVDNLKTAMNTAFTDDDLTYIFADDV